MNIISSGCVGCDPLIIEIQVEWISARLEDGDEVAAPGGHRNFVQPGVGFLVRPRNDSGRRLYDRSTDRKRPPANLNGCSRSAALTFAEP